jgi:hypothetical protein
MRSNPRRLRLTAWLIIACILGMLSSGLVHALTGSLHQAAPWQEICSLNGTAKAAGDSQQDDAQANHAAHCAFCSKYDHVPVLLSRVDTFAPQRLRQVSPQALVLTWPPGAPPTWTHRPRGPP